MEHNGQKNGTDRKFAAGWKVGIPCIVLFVIISLLVLNQCSLKSTTADNNNANGAEEGPRAYLRLLKATGNLRIHHKASTDTYEAYFHIPIAFEEQVPIYLNVESSDLIDYRFLRLAPPNVIAVATMRKADWSALTWEAFVMVKDIRSSSPVLPSFVALPSPGELPEETLKWLGATSCVQVDDALVRETAAEVKGNIDNLRVLSNAIAEYCYQIPLGPDHIPWSFDAVSALKWGNSCTGHAHAGAALFRANGIPARSILNITTLTTMLMDMHWIIDYYVPGSGWIKMETSWGQNGFRSYKTVVVMVCEPEYENPLFYPCGIEGFWFSSDPAVGIPNWSQAHEAVTGHPIEVPTNKLEQFYDLALSAWDRYVDTRGINMNPEEQEYIETAFHYQEDAKEELWVQNNFDNGFTAVQNALTELEKIRLNSFQTVLFDDFEAGNTGWTHGGLRDEWELGTPTYDSITAYSGNHCWATDLDHTYENNADCWLLSPVISLENFSCAYLHVNIRNSIADDWEQQIFPDSLRMEITGDNGQTFTPLCTDMGGVNDDPEVPDKGGWGFLALDLTRYVGQKVQIRFHLLSDDENVQAGAHIDDFHVFGRK